MADDSPVKNRLQDLLGYPREDLGLELKNWLDLSDEGHKADLAKALLALTNHGGGHVLIGFREAGSAWEPDPKRPLVLDGYNQDAINGIVAAYAEPGFHCEVHCLPHQMSEEVFPIIVVPPSSVPTRSRRDGPHDKSHKPRHVAINTYYVRRAGPKSESPQTGQDWDRLIDRCVKAKRDDLVRQVRDLFGPNPTIHAQVERPNNDLKAWLKEASQRRAALIHGTPQESLYSRGVWVCGYVLRGQMKKLSLGEFREVLLRVQGHETGWPVWWNATRSGLEPYPSDGMIECWLRETTFNDPAHADYWLGAPSGKMFLARGYQEDSMPKIEPGTALDLTIPVWRVGECLRHAERLAAELADGETLTAEFGFQWSGLRDRRIEALANPLRTIFPRSSIHEDVVESTISVPADQITATLPDRVREILRPLYNAFDFLDPPVGFFQEEIDQMLARPGRR